MGCCVLADEQGDESVEVDAEPVEVVVRAADIAGQGSVEVVRVAGYPAADEQQEVGELDDVVQGDRNIRKGRLRRNG